MLVPEVLVSCSSSILRHKGVEPKHQQLYKPNLDQMRWGQADNQKVVEPGTLTPLTGDMERESKTLYFQLSKIVFDKWNQPYSIVASWMRKKIACSSFSVYSEQYCH